MRCRGPDGYAGDAGYIGTKKSGQAMESPEWGEWRKAEETEMLGMVENCVCKQVARPKDKLVVGTKCSTSEKSDRKARSRSTRADLSDKGSGRWKVNTTRKVLAHASDRVNPDAFGIGSGQGRRAAPFQCGAGGY